MAQFSTVSDFLGYENKREVTNQQPGVLIAGSRNVVSTDGDTVKIRNGYTLLGQANSSLSPIESSAKFQKLRVGGISLRSYGDQLEFYFSQNIGEGGAWQGDGTWRAIASGFTSVNFNFTSVYDSNEQDDKLIFVNGTSDLFEWTGGIAVIDSVTTSTLTKKGTQSWAERGFAATGTKQVEVDGITYTYTGGEDTDTLTGVTPDPAANGVAQDDLVVQSVVTNSTTPTTSYNNDLVLTLDNQLFVGSLTNRQVFVSKTDDYTDFSFSSPRLPGEGALLTLDAPPVGFDISTDGDGEKFLRIGAGEDFWYQTKFTLSSDLTKETLSILPLKSSTLQAPIAQSAIGKLKNYTVFISKEPTLDFLGRIQDINTPQSLPLSDRIKTDFDSYDFTGGIVTPDIIYYRNNLYISVPQESILLVYNVEKGFWEAPWDLPAGRLAVIDGELCFHSNAVPETYKLFQGFSDNGNAINGVARFSYLSYGDRVNLKSHTETYAEGYIADNTELTRRVLFDIDGSSGSDTVTISGKTSNIIFKTGGDGSIGKNSLGKQSLGGGNPQVNVNKFRVIHSNQRADFFEEAFEFSSNDIDYEWEIVSFGSDITKSSNKPIKIKQ